MLLARCFLICCILQGLHALSSSEFFPFGADDGDRTLFRSDDDSTAAICPSVAYPFYGKQHSCFRVSNNGIITFTTTPGAFRGYTFPFAANYQTIAPFYADVDTRGTGSLWYREVSDDPVLMEMVDKKIHQAFVTARDYRSQSVFITTWQGVGHFRASTDRVNTFQCVMASDSNSLYVLFLYADIQWTRADEGSALAQAGFNAGDNRTFYLIPGSGTEAIRNINSTSNVGVPGMWIFKVSESFVQTAECKERTSRGGGVLFISPTHGNQLGGDLVSIQGPCFSDRANIQCDFDGQTSVALYESQSVVHCVTPRLSRTGHIPLRIKVDGEVHGEATFMSLNIESGHRVDLSPFSSSAHPLMLTRMTTSNTEIDLSWSPEAVFPRVNITQDPFNLDVLLYSLNPTTEVWQLHSTLASNIPNDGLQRIILPNHISNDIAPIAIQVATSLHPNTRFDRDGLLYMKVFRSQQRVGVWTSQFYSSSINPDSADTELRSLCQSWYDQEPVNLPPSLTSEALPCAPTLDRARLPTSGLSEVVLTSVFGNSQYRSQWFNTFHAGAEHCFRQSRVNTRSSSDPPAEQECCYDNRGILMTGSPSGGSISKVARESSPLQHFLQDLRPFFLCCTGTAPNCGRYYEKRPSNDGRGFNPPAPGWIMGDPHFVTLDGLRYTFNGQGEFVMVQTPDDSFTLQGRMIPFPNNSQATVFSAVAARVGVGGDRVMITSSFRGLDVYVNDRRVDMEVVPQQDFDNFTINSNGTDVMLVHFVNGVELECHVEATRGLMTTVVVGIPRTFVNRVKGLLGVYNGIESDDLIPTGSLVALSTDLSLRDIHTMFGLSWIIRNQSRSLFTYLPYESFQDFLNETYQPLFNLAQDPAAMAFCGGDSFCYYDMLVTGDSVFARDTLSTVHEVARNTELLRTVTCEPSCSNGGVCLEGNVCSCPLGFSGPHCQTIETEGCGVVNPCRQGEMCVRQAGSYKCILDCTRTPLSNLCTPVPPSLTTTTTIIIATVCSGVGLILFTIFIVILVCLACRTRSPSKVTTNGKDSEPEDFSEQTSDKSTTESKTDHPFPSPPSYSLLEMEKHKQEAVYDSALQKTVPNSAFETAEGQEYQNIPPTRRASLGVARLPTRLPSNQSGNEFPMNRDFPTRAHSHTVISISPESEDSNHSSQKTGSNIQFHQNRISELWYRSSTPSIQMQGPSLQQLPTSPASSSPYSPTSPTIPNHTPNPTHGSHRPLQQTLSSPGHKHSSSPAGTSRTSLFDQCTDV